METKFKVGDRVLCTENGNYGNVTFVDTSQVGEYFGRVWYEVLLDDGRQMWTTGEDIKLSDVDKKTAFLTELKELMEKYDAKIFVGDKMAIVDGKGGLYPFLHIQIGDDTLEYCITEQITPSNIFDYDK